MKSMSLGNNTNEESFEIFTHVKKRKANDPSWLIKDYRTLREAVLELFLQVKIRPDIEVDVYNEENLM